VKSKEGALPRGELGLRHCLMRPLGSVSAFIKTHDRRLGVGIEIQLKANDWSRRVSLHRQSIDADGIHREEIAVRVIPRWWAGAAVAGGAEIGARLQRTYRQFWCVGIAGVERKR